MHLVRSLSLPFGAGKRGAGELGDEAVAVADAVEGGVAGVLAGDLQSEDERLDQARVQATGAEGLAAPNLPPMSQRLSISAPTCLV